MPEITISFSKIHEDFPCRTIMFYTYSASQDFHARGSAQAPNKPTKKILFLFVQDSQLDLRLVRLRYHLNIQKYIFAEISWYVQAYSRHCQTSKMEIFSQQFMAFSRQIFLQQAPSYMFDRVRNTPLVRASKFLQFILETILVLILF